MDFQALLNAILAFLAKFFPSVGLSADAPTARISLVEWIKFGLSLLPLPSVADKDDCREWLVKVLGVLSEITAKTETSLDDEGVKVIEAVVVDDNSWDLLWSLFERALNGSLTLDEPDDFAAAKLVGETANLDPVTIIAIISAVVQLIQLWRNRNS